MTDDKMKVLEKLVLSQDFETNRNVVFPILQAVQDIVSDDTISRRDFDNLLNGLIAYILEEQVEDVEF